MLNETNEDVCIYTLEEFILADIVTLLDWFGMELHWFIYRTLNRYEKCENTIHSHLTQKRSENYIQLRNLVIEIWTCEMPSQCLYCG